MADPIGRCWRLWDDDVIDTASEGLARDSEMAACVASGESLPTARLWTAERAIVATARERRRPDFAHAAERLQAEGWPVVVRMTGGSAFPTGPEILNLSLAFRRADADTIDSVYRLLCAPIQDALAQIGLETKWGRGRGAFCEGESDLLFRGSKLVGTAQCWKAGGGILAHAGILIAGDMRAASHAINRFHLWSGATAQVQPAAVTSVACALEFSGRDDERELMRGVRSYLRQSLSRLLLIRMEPRHGTLRLASARVEREQVLRITHAP